jgi:hypothetical protein
MTDAEIQKHIMTLTVEQIDEITERFAEKTVGQWNNFIHRRLLCVDLYREELQLNRRQNP